PGGVAGYDALAEGGFDFVAITVDADDAGSPSTAAAVKAIQARWPTLSYAFLVNGDPGTVAAATLDRLADSYDSPAWLRLKGKPLIYTFGELRPSGDERFTFIDINNDLSGDQYWIADPPNIKYGLMTLVPAYQGRGTVIDPGRTGEALDRQTAFARNNRDRAVLVLWHSWNNRSDGSAIIPHEASGSTGPVDVYERVKTFNAEWKRP
ncbi:MAG: hypothetical protein M3N59_00960, partial [bacterium]|nr:hypothetical protein [bacterium]